MAELKKFLNFTPVSSVFFVTVHGLQSNSLAVTYIMLVDMTMLEACRPFHVTSA